MRNQRENADVVAKFSLSVGELEERLSDDPSVAPQKEVARWISACGSASNRSLATDAAMLEVCRRIAGKRPEFNFLCSMGAQVELNDRTINRFRSLCREEVSMLGPLYEASSERRHRYTLGQYFTPTSIASFVAKKVIAFGADSVLDPAVGAGALLAPLPKKTHVTGYDIDPLCVAMAKAGLSARGFENVEILKSDFLAKTQIVRKFDAIICNPPYVRHQLIHQDEKQRLLAHFRQKFEVNFSSLSTGYVYFILEAIDRLKDGGLLVFITPADFLESRFGEGLKKVLGRNLSIDEMILFDRSMLAFPEAVTTSMITFARKKPPTNRHRIRFNEAICKNESVVLVNSNKRLVTTIHPEVSWTTFFGDREKRLRGLTKERNEILSNYLRIRRGILTGDNEFFVLSQPAVDRWQLKEEFLVPVVASARDLPDNELTTKAWESIRLRGRPCWLLSARKEFAEIQDEFLLRYLEYGTKMGVPGRFNCRTRTPWYKPENVLPPDIIITYMSRGRTRFVRNSAGCRVMSSLLNGFLVDHGVDVGFLLHILNDPETGAIIKEIGRTYGSGLGKIEPRALSGLPIPKMRLRSAADQGT